MYRSLSFKERKSIIYHLIYRKSKESVCIGLIRILNLIKTILTNLHVDLDYFVIKKKLPSNIIPAYDGLSFSF